MEGGIAPRGILQRVQDPLPGHVLWCRVTLSDQSVYAAKIVGFDQDKDVAVLHIDAPPESLRPLSVGSSSDLMVGQRVYAIGNPVRSVLWNWSVGAHFVTGIQQWHKDACCDVSLI